MAGRRPRLLDLFCGAGGAARGYELAGFEVVGVDINPQPNYPYKFCQADVRHVLISDRSWVSTFDAVHASPPCQAYSDLQKRTKRSYPRLIEPVRHRLISIGLPYVIENVEGAPLFEPTVLCGTMFPPLRVLRHRLFETNFDMPETPIHLQHPLVFTHDKRKAHYGLLNQNESFVQVTGGGNCTVKNARDAMGIDWMTKDELNEAIPPAYTGVGRLGAHGRSRTTSEGGCVVEPVFVVAKALKALYPQNPDIVLGREARTIVAYLDSAGYVLAKKQED